MKHPFKIYTQDNDGLNLIAEGDWRTTELFREACSNIVVKENSPEFDVNEEESPKGAQDLARLKSELDYTRALADYHGAL